MSTFDKGDIVPAISEQFEAAKVFYGKEDCRLGIHFEVNFSPEELRYLDAWKILGIGYRLCEYMKNFMPESCISDLQVAFRD